MDFFRQYNTNYKQLFEQLDETKGQMMHDELTQVWTEFNIATDETTVADAEYLEVLAEVDD